DETVRPGLPDQVVHVHEPLRQQAVSEVLPDESSRLRAIHGPRHRPERAAGKADGADQVVLARAAVDRSGNAGVDVLEEEDVASRVAREVLETGEGGEVLVGADVPGEPSCAAIGQ